MKHLIPLILLTAIAAATATFRPVESEREAATHAANAELDIFALNARLGRGINLGNCLEAPTEGAWGIRLEAEYFSLIKRAGFDSVRIPIRWSAHAEKEAPYTIDSAFFERVDWAVGQAAAQGLAVVLNVHHYDEMMKEPDEQLARLMGLWRQISERYQGQPQTVCFELLNEPNGKLSDEKWNEMIPKLVGVIREWNPKRAIVVGPGQWNNVNNLKTLKLPEDDRRLIVTVHYYLPFKFTHQGASWVKGSDAWKGTRWPVGDDAVAAVQRDLTKAAAWGKAAGRPVYLGEFGAYSAADMESRVKWTKAVADAARSGGISFAYWEFGSGFGAYDIKSKRWREELKGALVGESAD